MLSIELIRKDPEYVRQALLARSEDVDIQRLADMDQRRRLAIQKGDGLRGRLNESSKRIGQTQKKPQQELIAELRQMGDEIKLCEQEVAEQETMINDFLLGLPNLPGGRTCL